jgi:hypothetical protein
MITEKPKSDPAPCGCPSSMMRKLQPESEESSGDDAPAGPAAPARSRLSHWPVQISLLPPQGDIWHEADVLIAADCVAFAMPDFHEKLLAGKKVAVGCPKLDDIGFYADKLTTIFTANNIRSVTVAHMEVPCCNGIVMAVKQALAAAGKSDIEFRDLMIGVDGKIMSEMSNRVSMN